MINSKLGNLSIAIPTQSRFKTLTDIDDRSVTVASPDADHNSARQLNHDNIGLRKWLQCRDKVTNQYIPESWTDNSKNTNCYMVAIEEIGDVSYRTRSGAIHSQSRDRERELQTSNKREEGSQKVYLKILGNFVNIEQLAYTSRTVQLNLIELEQQSKSNHLYKATDVSVALFLHSKLASNSQYRVRLDFVVVESWVTESTEFVYQEEYLGFCDIDVFKGIKTKQKGSLYSPRINGVLDSYVYFTVLLSDSFKPLQKLLPTNCLISSQQSLAGLAGRKLPSTISPFHYPIEYTQLLSLRLDIMGIDILDTNIFTKLRQAQAYMRCMQSSEGFPVANIKEVRLEGLFHNGWTAFCENSIRLNDKMEIQRKASKKSNGEVIKIKHYTTEELFNIPFIFLDEQAILILQISAKIQVKTSQSSSPSTHISLPLCYTYYTLSKLSTDEKQTRPLYLGEYLSESSETFASRSHSCVGSKIEFYITIDQANKMQLSKHLVTVHSNKSNANISSGNVPDVDRIGLEKERMIRENRKLKQINRIKKIELNQDIPVLDTTNFKENMYRNQIDRLREERKEKEEVVEYLRRKLKELTPEPVEQESLDDSQLIDVHADHINKFKNRVSSQSYYDAVFYKAALEKNTFSTNHGGDHFEHGALRVRMLPIFQGTHQARVYACGEVPLEIIKTEMLQKNYSYGVFFNCVSLMPSSPERALPRKVYFVLNFFGNPNLQTCECTINQTTGQLVPVLPLAPSNTPPPTSKSHAEQSAKSQHKHKSQKILFVEVGPQESVRNNDSVFVEFISYLYHGEMQVRVYDAVSGIEFGAAYFRMRDLLRVRRNEVEVVRDIWVTKDWDVRAKLKLEVKVIRKQSQKQGLLPIVPTISPLQSLSLQGQARQLQRIAQYKKLHSSISQAEQKITRMLNTEIIKQELHINTYRMRGELIKIDVSNRKNYVEEFQVVVNDPDQLYLLNEELVVVSELLWNNICETKWFRFIESVGLGAGGKGGQNTILVDERGCFDIEPGQTKQLMFYYYSERKYEKDFFSDHKPSPFNTDQTNHIEPPLKHYNHRHCISISLSNPQTHTIEHLYNIHISPQPDPQCHSHTLLHKPFHKVQVNIPFPSQDYVLYIDNPTVVSTLNEELQVAELYCTAGGEGLCERFAVSVLSPFPENRMLGGYRVEIWGAREIGVDGTLWETQQVLVDFHSSIGTQKGISYVVVVTEDEKTAKLKDRNPIKINQSQSKSFFRLSVCATTIGTIYRSIYLLSGIDQSILYWYSLRVECGWPTINEKITLRIKLTDKILEEPFNFRNEQSRKQRYSVMSTHPHILWCSNTNLEVEGKGEKRIKIIINAEQLTENQHVVIGFIGDKVKVHYLFILELDMAL